MVYDLQSGEFETLSSRLISLDRVFTPPKFITQNLEKRKSPEKPKVVSAVDSWEKAHPFNYSYKVGAIFFPELLTFMTGVRIGLFAFLAGFTVSQSIGYIAPNSCS